METGDEARSLHLPDVPEDLCQPGEDFPHGHSASHGSVSVVSLIQLMHWGFINAPKPDLA